MTLPFLNTAPSLDKELRNSVFFERGLHATILQGLDEAGIASAAGIAASMGVGLLEANRTRRDCQAGPMRLGRALRRA